VHVEGRPRLRDRGRRSRAREDEKTSSVHFLRFELTEDMAKALKYGVSLAIGVDHPNYRASIDRCRRCARRLGGRPRVNRLTLAFLAVLIAAAAPPRQSVGAAVASEVPPEEKMTRARPD